MDNDQVIPAKETAPEIRGAKDNPQNTKVIWIVAGVVAVIGIGIFSYVLGTKNNSSKTSESVSPTPELITQITNTPAPTENVSPTVTGSLTPTKKPTSTPTLTPSPTPVIKVKILSSTASLDGFRASNNGGNDSLEIRAGRNDTLVQRGFVSFSLSDIPAGSTITEATLRLYQSQILGNAYGVGGSVKIDHLNYGDSLDSTDYGMAALSSSFATLTSNATIEWKDSSVTTQVKDDFANTRSRSQFRIHMNTENTGGTVTGDFSYFESADNNMGTGNTPQLVIKYY